VHLNEAGDKGGVRMMKIPLIALLLQGIPEEIGVVTLAFVIDRIPLKWNQVLLIGIVLAFCAYVVRLFPIPFGIHTMLLLFILFTILTRLSKGNVGLSFMASSASFLALVIFETVCLSSLMAIFGFTPITLFADLSILIAFSEPQVLLLLISAFLLNKSYIRKSYLKTKPSPNL